MARELFGTDGVRGTANEGNMAPEVAFQIGAAVTYQAKKYTSHKPRVVICKDTRVSGYLLETAITSGVCSQGGVAYLTGPLPTPAIAYLTRSMRADVGVVISASHNPYQDNGIKLFGSDGFKLADDREEELEQLMQSGKLERRRPTGINVGRAERMESALGRYVAYVKSAFPQQLTLEDVHIVVDAANGAAYQTAPSVFRELGATVYSIGVKPNGRNINKQCGALHPEACAREVRRRKADIGIALDGDADRLIVIDEKGNVVNGDAVMALCATRMLRDGSLKHKTLVATLMSNLGLQRAIEKEKGKLVHCAVGDRYVVETMRNGGYNFGGEQSGHLVFLDYATTGDGLLGALRLLAIILREQRPLSTLAGEVMQHVPQVLVNVTLPERKPLEEMKQTTKAMRDTENKLGKEGRVVVRWSGTEPKLRIMIEGPDQKTIREMAHAIAEKARNDSGPKSSSQKVVVSMHPNRS